jgi:8-hydroxy-5-deazaflavin:NADPH oxidoreductase
MKISVLGTGMVGKTISSKLVDLGHQVMMGSRTKDNSKANEWVSQKGKNASQGTFAESAAFGEIIFNCTGGLVTLDVLKMAGEENLNGKVLIDLANPLDFSNGMPPSLAVCNTDSLGEQIQKAFPEAKVVKTLNTMNCQIMVNPSLVNGDHDVFISGNDQQAKDEVSVILKDWFGWKKVIDLGDITTARGTEMMLPIWLRLYGTLKTPNFNFKVVM